MNDRLRRNARIIAALGLMVAGRVYSQDDADVHPANRSYVSAGGGHVNFEGDEPVKDAGIFSFRFGWRLDEAYSLETGFDLAPNLTGNRRTDALTGERISRLDETAGVKDTESVRIVLDALRHFNQGKPFDPYLALGVGAAWHADRFDQRYDGFLQAGAGCFYHLNESWSLRADARGVLAGDDTEMNATVTLGVAFRPGAQRTPGHAAVLTDTPAPPDENLQFFELRLMFDPDDWKIKSEYFSEIGVIGKILRDDPAATARIEAHVDASTTPSTRRALTLSQRRAQAVKDALTADWKIDAQRMTTSGYGYSRPKDPATTKGGTPGNERIEIFIRRGSPVQ